MHSYIVAAKRTAIASFLGSLKDFSAANLQAAVIKKTLAAGNIKASQIEEVIIGNVLQAGNGQGIARQASIYANIPETTPAYTVNMICGSGLKSIMIAESEIAAGRFHCVLAGGVEHMSSAPFLLPANIRNGHKIGNITLVDSLMHDGLTDAFHEYPMGITAENIAERYQISRQEQDNFSLMSQEKAITAVDTDLFKEEIINIEIHNKRDPHNFTVFNTDEYPNRTSTLEKLASLRPAFKENGTVTAGNASGINDGASAVLVMSDKALKRTASRPLARIVASREVGVDPAFMGIGPVKACTELMEKTGIGISDIGLIELNEAFAVQSLAVIKELSRISGNSPESIMQKTNVNGGAIALGHPIGCSGNRIVVTLLHEMKRRDVRYGMAALCIGGGMGVAMLFELIEYKH